MEPDEEPEDEETAEEGSENETEDNADEPPAVEEDEDDDDIEDVIFPPPPSIVDALLLTEPGTGLDPVPPKGLFKREKKVEDEASSSIGATLSAIFFPAKPVIDINAFDQALCTSNVPWLLYYAQ